LLPARLPPVVFWAIAAWAIITADRQTPRELWTMTREKVKSLPTLVRAAVPRSLVSAGETYADRTASLQTSVR
jgi:hypothetical protein